jgi:hypothetical protein
MTTTRPAPTHAAPYSLAAENLAFFASWGRVLMRQTCVGTHRANVTAVTR